MSAHRIRYRTTVLAAILGLQFRFDEQGVWWIEREDGTKIPATTDQVQTWAKLVEAPRFEFEEAVIAFAAEEATARTRPLFALLKGRGTEEGEL